MSENSQVEQPRRPISELKVNELKLELEKRGLDKGGVKAMLVERLEKALKSEGHDIGSSDGQEPKEDLQQPTDESQISAATASNAEQQQQSKATTKKEQTESEDDSDIVMVEINEANEAVEAASSQDGEKDKQPAETEKHIEGAENATENIEPTPRATTETSTTSEDNTKDSGVDATKNGEVTNELTTTAETSNGVVVSADGDEPESKSSNNPLSSESEQPPPTTTTPSTTTTTAQPKAVQEKSAEADIAASMWIRGISNSTKAADLKIFTTKNKLSPSCFGYITMSEPAMAEVCIQKLNRVNLKGKLITVEKASRSLLPQISKAGKAQPPTTPTADKPPANVSTQKDNKPQESPREVSPEVIIDSVRPAGTTTIKKPAAKPNTKSGGESGKKGSGAQKPRIISTKSSSSSARKITPPSSSTRSDTRTGGVLGAAATRSTTLRRSIRPATTTPGVLSSRRFVSTTSATTRAYRLSNTGSYVISSRQGPFSARTSNLRYARPGAGGESGGGETTPGFRRTISTFRKPLEFNNGVSTTRLSQPSKYPGPAFRTVPSSVPRHRSAERNAGHHYHRVGATAAPMMMSRSPPRHSSSVERAGGSSTKMPTWEREEMIRLMRRKEEEYRKKEEELKMEREREKMRFERERLEREKLEIKLANAQFAFMASTPQQTGGGPMPPPPPIPSALLQSSGALLNANHRQSGSTFDRFNKPVEHKSGMLNDQHSSAYTNKYSGGSSGGGERNSRRDEHSRFANNRDRAGGEEKRSGRSTDTKRGERSRSRSALNTHSSSSSTVHRDRQPESYSFNRAPQPSKFATPNDNHARPHLGIGGRGAAASSSTTDPYQQQVNRFMASSSIAPTHPGSRAANKYDGGSSRGGRTGGEKADYSRSSNRTGRGSTPNHSGRKSSPAHSRARSRDRRDDISSSSAAGHRKQQGFLVTGIQQSPRNLLESLGPNPNSAQFRTDPSYASRLGLNLGSVSGTGAGRNADEMFGGSASGLGGLNTFSSGASSYLGRNSGGGGSSYRDTQSTLPNSYQNTLNAGGSQWNSLGGGATGGSTRSYLGSGISNENNNIVGSAWQSANGAGGGGLTGGESFWNSSTGARSTDWNALNSAPQQPQQSARFSGNHSGAYDNKQHSSSSSFSRRY